MRRVWVLLAAGLLVGCGGGKISLPTPSGAQPSVTPRTIPVQATPTQKANRSKLTPGATGTVRAGAMTLTFTIVSFIDAATIPCSGACSVPEAGKRFMNLTLIAENAGTANASISGFESDWKLRTSDGFERKGETGFGTPDGPFKNSDLTPGGKEKGTISFYIGTDTQVQWVRYTLTNGIPGSTGPSVYFDAP